MVRGGANKVESSEMEEKKRLKKLALKNNVISENPATAAALNPSKTLIKHHGKDIIRKSKRTGKNRYLFSFPALMAPISGGKIGELKDLGTKNPILYLDFPQGQMKLFGTIVYPMNRYLTLQFSKTGKNVICEDYFDNMIVFSEAWWIGRKDENPEEARLEFPMEMNVEPEVEYDFKAGAGGSGTSERKTKDLKTPKKFVPQYSPEHESEDVSTDSQKMTTEVAEVTPSRRSARTAGKTKKYVEEFSVETSGGSFVDTKEETLEEEEEIAVVDIHQKNEHDETEMPSREVLDLEKDDTEAITPIAKKRKQSTTLASKSKEPDCMNPSTMIQPTIATFLKKAEEKISGPKSKEKATGRGKDESTARKKQAKAPIKDEDDIEEFSSSQDTNTSDEDWDV